MCHTEPVVGRVLGEAEPRNAEGEHRRAGHFQGSLLSSISARWTRRSASTTQARRRISRVAERSCSLHKEARAGFGFMNASVHLAFLCLVQRPGLGFCRDYLLALERRRRSALSE